MSQELKYGAEFIPLGGGRLGGRIRVLTRSGLHDLHCDTDGVKWSYAGNGHIYSDVNEATCHLNSAPPPPGYVAPSPASPPRDEEQGKEDRRDLVYHEKCRALAKSMGRTLRGSSFAAGFSTVEGDEISAHLMAAIEAWQDRISNLAADLASLKASSEEMERNLAGAHEMQKGMLRDCRAYAERIAELEKELAEAKFAPLGDNHHNALKCPYCNPHGTLIDTAARAATEKGRG